MPAFRINLNSAYKRIQIDLPTEIAIAFDEITREKRLVKKQILQDMVVEYVARNKPKTVKPKRKQSK